jgi:hypothetical protein
MDTENTATTDPMDRPPESKRKAWLNRFIEPFPRSDGWYRRIDVKHRGAKPKSLKLIPDRLGWINVAGAKYKPQEIEAIYGLEEGALYGTANNQKPEPVSEHRGEDSYIPLAMRELRQWVVWKRERRKDGKLTKVPYIAGGDGLKAKTNDPSTWRDYHLCVQQVAQGEADGIGFVFSEDDGLFGIDLDHCYDGQEFTPIASEIISRFEGHAHIERSPSGDGVHIIGRGSLIRSGKGADDLKWIEGYDWRSPRYFTVSGHTLDGGQAIEPEDCAEQAEWISGTYLKKAEPTKLDGSTAPVFDEAAEADDDKLIALIRKSPKQGDKFSQLFDDGAYVNRETGEVTTDQSSLDMMLVELLAFWCSRDEAQMDRIFRRSALLRDKWDSRRGRITYGGITIANGIKFNLENGARAFKDARPNEVDLDVVPKVLLAALKKLATECSKSEEELASSIEFDTERMNLVINGTALNQQNTKFVVVTPKGEYRVFTDKKAASGLQDSLGHFYRQDALRGKLEAAADQEGLSGRDANAFIVSGISALQNAMLRFISTERQFGTMSFMVDMFATEASIRIDDGCAHITFPHRPFAEGEIDPVLLADYKDHWPMLDDFIELLVASRFAAARKKAYVWLMAESDWGKGLLEGALNNLGLLVSMSETEVEKLFSGNPVGRQMQDFKWAWILHFNEFKKTKAELKMLEQRMSFSPKNLPVCEVQLYLKLFTSAESVESLVSTSTGVEDQFANRFSLLKPTGNLDTRPLFAKSRKRYLDSVTAYLSQQLNKKVAEYVFFGPEGAADVADNVIIEFHKRHGIAQSFERLSTKIESLCREHLEWIRSEYKSAKINNTGFGDPISQTERSILESCLVLEDGDKKLLYAKTPGRLLAIWLELIFNQAERGKLTVKSESFRKHLPPIKPVWFPELRVKKDVRLICDLNDKSLDAEEELA